MSSFDYYTGDPRQFGNEQYVKLEDVINTYLASRTSDDRTLTVPRHIVLIQARRGLRELYYDVVQDIRRYEMEISPSLTVVLPPDFVNYVRISWVDNNGHLHPMAVDKSMNIANSYLQDNLYRFLYDDSGCILEGSGVREKKSFNNNINDDECIYEQRFAPNVDMSAKFTNGNFRVNRENGVIEFGSVVEGKNIVIEYISDGLFTGCEGRPEADIRIHKFAENALMDFIYWKLIERSANTPANEKMRARKEFFNSRRIAKRRINTVRREELLQIFKGSTQWIKRENL